MLCIDRRKRGLPPSCRASQTERDAPPMTVSSFMLAHTTIISILKIACFILGGTRDGYWSIGSRHIYTIYTLRAKEESERTGKGGVSSFRASLHARLRINQRNQEPRASGQTDSSRDSHPVRGREPGWLGSLAPRDESAPDDRPIPGNCNGLDRSGHAPQLSKGGGRGKKAARDSVIVTSMAGRPRPGSSGGCVQLPRLLSSRGMKNARIPLSSPSIRTDRNPIIPSCSPAAFPETHHSPRALSGNAGG